LWTLGPGERRRGWQWTEVNGKDSWKPFAPTQGTIGIDDLMKVAKLECTEDPWVEEDKAEIQRREEKTTRKLKPVFIRTREQTGCVPIRSRWHLLRLHQLRDNN
jgi:hypothetical protein